MKIDSEEGARKIHEFGVTVYQEQGYNNFAPIIMALEPDTDKIYVGLIEVTRSHAYAQVQRMVMDLPFVPEAIAFTADVFSYKLDNATEEEKNHYLNQKTRPLKELFDEGDPHVREMLSTQVMSAHGSWMISQTYKWSVYDGFEWDEPLVGITSNWDFDRLVNGKPKLNHDGHPICPKCNGLIPNDAEPGAYIGALSRRDNRTEICSNCGVVEAMEDFAKFVAKKEK
jgi:hypothetical protein